MLGQPDPIIVPVRGKPIVGGQTELARAGFVSVWIGAFSSLEEAEAYFGIPDEIGVYLPAEAFASDFNLGHFPPEKLEVNFEQTSERPIKELLQDATFGPSFLDTALETAAKQGIDRAQGVALLYDFDYRLNPAQTNRAGPLRFVGVFAFVR